MAECFGRDEVAGKRRRSIPRLLLRCLVGLVLLVLLAYGGSNLWLMSPWCRGMVAKKLSQRTGYECKVGSMSWSPWNGCSMGGVSMLQPEDMAAELDEPVVTIRRIRVQPYWLRMLRGGIRPREILIDSPQLTLSLELLAKLTGARLEDLELLDVPPPEVPMELAAVPTGEGPLNLPEAGQPAGPVAQAEVQQQAPSPPQQPVRERTTPPELRRPTAGLPTLLRIKDASFRLVSLAKQRDLLRIKGISMDLPVYGEDAVGRIGAASLQLAGFPELRDLEQEIVWKRPHLWIEEKEVDLGGVVVSYGAQLAMGRNTGGRYPFLVDMVIAPQQVQSVEGLRHVGLQAAAGMLVGKFRLLGLLRSPTSWQGQMLVLGKEVSLRRGQGQHVVFDEMQLPAILHMGKLYWANAEMVGEDLSLLGNGRIAMRGGSILSVTRLVASPEVAVELTKSLQRAEITKGPWWQDLGTPDRLARDLTVSGSWYNPVVDAGDNHARIPLARLVGPVFKAVSPEGQAAAATPMTPVPGKGIPEGGN